MRRCTLAIAVLVAFGAVPAAASARDRPSRSIRRRSTRSPTWATRTRLRSSRTGRRRRPTGLHHVLRGAGAGGQQAARRRAAADREDDDPPPPVLRPSPGGPVPGIVPRPHRPPRGGGAARALRQADSCRRAGQVRHQQPDNDGQAPNWILVAMVMNHYARAKDFYVRTKVRYTTDPREPVSPIILGDCTNRLSGNLYDVPGGGDRVELRRPGIVARPGWIQRAHHPGSVAPARRRALPDAREPDLRAAASQGARLLRPAEPPLQHRQADPARTGADRERHFRQREGHSDHRGRGAHQAGRARRQQPARGGHGVLVAPGGEGRTGQALWARSARPAPINRPPRFAKHPDYDLRVPQLAKPQGPVTPFDGNPITLGDDFFRPDRISARVGETISWRFGGALPHSVLPWQTARAVSPRSTTGGRAASTASGRGCAGSTA